MEQATTDIKRKLIKAIFSGNMKQAKELQRQLLFAEEMPLFIQYEVKNGKVHLDWKDMTMTVQEFEQLKKDCPQVVCWQEEKADMITIADTERKHIVVPKVPVKLFKKKEKPQKVEPDVKDRTPSKKPERQPAPQKDHFMGRAEMEFIRESNEILQNSFPQFT